MLDFRISRSADLTGAAARYLAVSRGRAAYASARDYARAEQRAWRRLQMAMLESAWAVEADASARRVPRGAPPRRDDGRSHAPRGEARHRVAGH